MTRERFLETLAALAALPLASCSPADPVAPSTGLRSGDPDPVRRSRTVEEWRRLLPPDAFAVLFEGWTEPPGSSPLTHERRAGHYLCAACHAPLFGSSSKYDSGTGWPTFSAPVADDAVALRLDLTLLEPRIEYHCRHCGGHQGHVFDDGPPPTGKRYCNNGLALRFVPAGQPLPSLRA